MVSVIKRETSGDNSSLRVFFTKLCYIISACGNVEEMWQAQGHRKKDGDEDVLISDEDICQ